MNGQAFSESEVKHKPKKRYQLAQSHRKQFRRMFQVNNYKLQMFGILLCLVVIALCGVVTTQEALAYQYTPPRQYFTQDRRRLPSYNGFNAASVPGNGDLIRFPDDSMSPVSLIHSVNDQNIFNERHKKDNRNIDESHHQQSNEVSALMQLVLLRYLFPFPIALHKKILWLIIEILQILLHLNLKSVNRSSFERWIIFGF